MSRLFVDTNVLIYADQPASPRHREARLGLDRAAGGTRPWISRQILREYVSAMTRTGASGHAPLSSVEAASAIEHFSAGFSVAEDGPAVTENLALLLRTIPLGGKQVHDANIVATMLAHDIDTLVTYNDADFRRFADLVDVVRPTTL